MNKTALIAAGIFGLGAAFGGAGLGAAEFKPCADAGRRLDAVEIRETVLRACALVGACAGNRGIGELRSVSFSSPGFQDPPMSRFSTMENFQTRLGACLQEAGLMVSAVHRKHMYQEGRESLERLAGVLTDKHVYGR